jgi:hypothetical protein
MKPEILAYWNINKTVTIEVRPFSVRTKKEAQRIVVKIRKLIQSELKKK